MSSSYTRTSYYALCVERDL